MARKVSDAITEARILLQDTVEPYRAEDTELVRYLNNATAELKRIRPDLFVGRGDTPLPYYSATETDLDLETPETYFSALVDYMVAFTELRDDESSADSKAMAFLKIFAMQAGAGR